MNTRTVSLLFGVILVAVGIVGFIPNPLVAPDGIFAVNLIHNLVHILTGGVFLVGAIMFSGIEGMVLKVVGAVYALVAILGFFASGGVCCWASCKLMDQIIGCMSDWPSQF